MTYNVPTTIGVPEFLAAKRDEIAALCREYGVAKLEVFGSVMTDAFDPERSDVDFIAFFEPDADLGPWMGRLLQLEDKLAAVLGANVDVILPTALKNPFFYRVAALTRQVLLDETDIRAAA